MVNDLLNNELNERQRDILRSIVNLYVLKAVPVGSRKLAKYLQGKLDLSPATLRNIMSDLEETGFIDHPHTSAGRIPTDKGYRYYVDWLMESTRLSIKELNQVKKIESQDSSETILKKASQVLGTLSNYLAVVRIPHLTDLRILKIDIIKIASNRLLIVLALDSNAVKTATLEIDFELEDKHLDHVMIYLNEKISGKTLKFVKDNFSEIIQDLDSSKSPFIRLFIDSKDKIFTASEESSKVVTSGVPNLLKYPEFEDIGKVRSVVELVENQDMVVHLLDSFSDNSNVLIGSEAGNELLEDYSIVLSKYRIGSASGSIGLIGPKRMNYAKMMALVNSVSEILHENDH